MPRTSRLTLDNAIFHVFNRGNSKQETFHSSEDFEHFLYIVAYYKAIHGFQLYHFCFMPNHFHFEPKIIRAHTLPKAMHDITQTYTNYHHQQYQTAGYLWQGRYKNMLVEEGNYHQKLGGYIERNPVRADLVKKPEDWQWSSYRFYAFGESIRMPVKIEGVKRWVNLVDEDPMYQEFGRTPKERQENYRTFILAMDDGKVKKELGMGERKLLLGSDKFKQKMTRFFEDRGARLTPRPRGRPRKKEE